MTLTPQPLAAAAKAPMPEKNSTAVSGLSRQSGDFFAGAEGMVGLDGTGSDVVVRAAGGSRSGRSSQKKSGVCKKWQGKHCHRIAYSIGVHWGIYGSVPVRAAGVQETDVFALDAGVLSVPRRAKG